MTQPVQEPTQGRTDSAQEWRTRQLFRRPAPPSSGGGIQFNSGTYGPENVGDWLSVETTGSIPSGPYAGIGMAWQVDTGSGVGGWLIAGAGDAAGAVLFLDASGSWTITSSGSGGTNISGSVNASLQAGTQLDLTSLDVLFVTSQNDLNIRSWGGDIILNAVEIFGNLPTSAGTTGSLYNAGGFVKVSP